MTSFSLATVAVDGKPTPAIVVDGIRYDLAKTAASAGIPGLSGDIASLFADWDASFAALSKAAEAAPAAGAALPDDAHLLAPLRYPHKVLCAGANYYDHIAEMGITDLRKESQRLFFFFKPPRQAVVGPGATVKVPVGSKMFDWEVEVACVFGRTARCVSEADALSYVAAYTVAIDLTARDLNLSDSLFKFDWVAGKAHDTCCPTGPVLVPAAFVKDPMDLALGLSVNGTVKQNARTSGMIFSIPEQIARLTRIMTMEPGDMLLTGTPAGVGLPAKTFLSVGDRVEASVEGIGTLAVTITPGDG